jgi:hypothetical protein
MNARHQPPHCRVGKDAPSNPHTLLYSVFSQCEALNSPQRLRTARAVLTAIMKAAVGDVGSKALSRIPGMLAVWGTLPTD